MCVFTVQFYASMYTVVVPLQAAHHLSKHTYYIFPRSTHGHIWEMHKLEMVTWKIPNKISYENIITSRDKVVTLKMQR